MNIILDQVFKRSAWLGFSGGEHNVRKFKGEKMKKLMVMVAALAMISTSAYAADWNFYGSARISTFYTSIDTINSPAPSVDNYSQALQGNSRIGATVKVSDELTGGFEYGTGVNVRKLYGEWNFGGGKLLVGQTYSPLNMFYSNQVFGSDNDMLAQGGIYSGREAMLQLTFGDFKVALVPTKQATDVVLGLTATSPESKIPGLEASYSMKMDNFSLKLAGGYQSYEADLGAVSYDVDSYVVALGGKVDLGAFYVGGNFYVGQNPGNLIFLSTGGDNGWDDGLSAMTATGIVDNDAWGAMIAGGFVVNDMFTVEAGYGFVETEYDIVGSTKDKAQAYYVQSVITLAPGVMVIPEVGVFDGDENGDSETTYFGAKWQINF